MEGSGRRGFSGRCALTLATLSIATMVSAQEPQYFDAPPEKPRLVFAWDALLRYDNISHLRVRPDIERGRFEFRPELDLVFSDRLRIGVRAVGDYATDHNTENVPNFDNYRSRGASIERYYLEAKPGQWTIQAGSFGIPLVATEMLWDHDIQTLGVALAHEVRIGTSTFTLAAAGFYGPQRQRDHTRIGVGQVVWRKGDPDRFALEVAATYWHFDPDLNVGAFKRQNYVVAAGNTLEYLSRYRVGDVILRLRFPVAGLPVTVSLDGAHNFGVRSVAKGDADAIEASVSVGRLSSPGDLRFFYTYQYVEQDAVLGAYNTDDWWFHSWYRGHRTGLAVTVLPRVFLQGSVTFQGRLNLQHTLNRFCVDLIRMF
ncbi:MAG TPA: putative porin [Thermoanaerobaculia bacterium]|nr:putative porin [Thermoanaerobaculia bacterium]